MTLKLPIQEICDKYLSGISTNKLGKEYGCDKGPIIKLLRRSGVKVSTTLDLPKQEIYDKYLSGISANKLGKEYGCCYQTIINFLKRNGVKIRTVLESRTLDLPKQEICNKYLSGISAEKLGVEYGCDIGTITNLLKRNSVKIRTHSESIKLAYKNDQTLVVRIAEGVTQTYKNDPTLAIRIAESIKIAHKNDPSIAERQSAIKQDQDYDAGEWTGRVDTSRPHLIPTAQCLQLNSWFEGCVRHHIMVGVIIHIPIDLHKSVRHRMTNGDRKDKNMKEINKLAFKYLLGRL